MKNFKDKVDLIVSATLVLIIASSYSLSTDLQINVNRTLSMLRLNDHKGILMYFYGLPKISAIAAMLIISEQTLVPILGKESIVYANYKFFGKFEGLLISLLGIMLGLLITFVIARSFTLLLKKFFNFNKVELFSNKFGIFFIIMISIIPIWPSALVGYLAGLAGIRMKNFLLPSILGQALCLILFF